eukprot:scaffold93544_cov72-Phaeocystis_antarctica.AAC.5
MVFEEARASDSASASAALLASCAAFAEARAPISACALAAAVASERVFAAAREFNHAWSAAATSASAMLEASCSFDVMLTWLAGAIRTVRRAALAAVRSCHISWCKGVFAGAGSAAHSEARAPKTSITFRMMCHIWRGAEASERSYGMGA